MAAKFNTGDVVKFTAEADGLVRPSVLHGRFRVVALLKTNARIEPVGGGVISRAPIDLLELATDDTAPAAQVIGVPYFPPLWEGTVVTVAGRGWKEPADVRWVVTAISRDDKYRIARLGGDSGRYYRSIPRQFLTEVKI